MKLQRYNFIRTFETKENFEQLCKRRKIQSGKVSIILTNKNATLKTRLFYSTDKIIKIKRNLIKKNVNKRELGTLKKKRTKLVNKVKDLFPNRNLFIEAKLLNKELDSTYTGFLYSNLKRSSKPLFKKRYTLFFDLIKVTNLAADSKENLHMLTKTLGTIFKYLPKRRHNMFISFVKQLLNLVVIKNPRKLLGMKILLNGKIQGKTRAKTAKVLVGNTRVNTIKDNPILSKVHIYTFYGAYGLQMLAKYKE